MKRTLLLAAAVAALSMACLPAAFATEAPAAAPSAAAPAASSSAPAPTAPVPTPAPTPAPPPASLKTVRARVLKDCQHGKVDDVVSLPVDVAKAEEKAGAVDTHKDAVAYALSLPQNRPKPTADET